MRILTGDESGLVKRITFPKILTKTAKPAPNKKPKLLATATANGKGAQQQQPPPAPVITPLIAKQNPARQVQMMVFATSTPADAPNSVVIVAHKGGWISVLEVDTGILMHEFRAFEPKTENGKEVLDSRKREEEFVGLYEAHGTIITCTSFGKISYHSPLSMCPPTTSDAEPSSDPVESKLPTFTQDLKMDNIRCMRVYPGSPDHFATGGDERDLCIWKVQSGENEETQVVPIWKAKNVKNDYLDMRVPIHIVDLRFLSTELPSPTKIVVVSHFQHFRIYDLNRDGKRPLLSVKVGEKQPIKRLALTQDGKEAIIGDTHGNSIHLEVSTGNRLGAYRGFAGAISDISSFDSEVSSTSELVAMVGLDRFLRIYERNGQRRLIHKIYLKQRMTTVLVDDKYDDPSNSESVDGKSRTKSNGKSSSKSKDSQDDGENEDMSDDDDVWAGMKTINESTKSKSKTKKRKSDS